MRIAFKGSHYFIPALKRLSEQHALASIDTFGYAEKLFAEHFPGIRIRSVDGRSDDFDGDETESRVDLFLVGGYPLKVDPRGALGINIHPSLLPEGRGAYPIAEIIQRRKEVAGFAIHLLENEFDTGAILYKEAQPLSKHDDALSYIFKIALRVEEVIEDIVSALPQSISKGEIQGTGSYWKTDFALDRRIVLEAADFGSIIDKNKAYPGGCQIELGGRLRKVTSISGWSDKSHSATKIRHLDPTTIVAEVTGGVVVIRTS